MQRTTINIIIMSAINFDIIPIIVLFYSFKKRKKEKGLISLEPFCHIYTLSTIPLSLSLSSIS